MNKEIEAFFNERKAAWLKKNTKASMSESELNVLTQECEQVFSLENWLPNAAKRAGQISISTHPCTFSHPSARKNKNGYVSSVISDGKSSNDGFMRTGNVDVAADALGNAAALDVYKFLMLLPQGQSLLSHIQQDTELAQELLTIKAVDYETLKSGFLAMAETNSEAVTSSKIKQVYFPINNNGLASGDDSSDYHQLSLLTASPLVFELRRRIDDIRFSEQTKAARANEKANLPDEQGYKRLYNLTTIGYGGTKPQNISVLNNQNGGKAHLLASTPPVLKKRDIDFPTDNFFTQAYSYYKCQDLFKALHQLYKNDTNNFHLRNERDDYYLSIIDRIVEHAWALRAVSEEQYFEQTSTLSSAQKIWLCHDQAKTREQQGDWLEDIVKSVSNYIFFGYEKWIGKQAIKFGDGEKKYIHQFVENNKEILR
ncbi:type I-F CRISPR-associated protein Csy1 [Endozoicomonas sp. G2_1]|uniref:type I-F CRISPR-associated protein Csy1 n=1 Tax=Endozoicomonas sp. G2_1 TaxID=2821091 RepID=UPI001ADCB52D|nr:type I-F CRISPR-associated protein Csy1 [Endozoicomonas sp. G2_1]MBO9489122.1 type I-F CRISPR-associated protein Csy1 [Endozoicomonas sp. G2_1]